MSPQYLNSNIPRVIRRNVPLWIKITIKPPILWIIPTADIGSPGTSNALGSLPNGLRKMICPGYITSFVCVDLSSAVPEVECVMHFCGEIGSCGYGKNPEIVSIFAIGTLAFDEYDVLYVFIINLQCDQVCKRWLFEERRWRE
jgi:hypothetical protein